MSSFPDLCGSLIIIVMDAQEEVNGFEVIKLTARKMQKPIDILLTLHNIPVILNLTQRLIV